MYNILILNNKFVMSFETPKFEREVGDVGAEGSIEEVMDKGNIPTNNVIFENWENSINQIDESGDRSEQVKDAWFDFNHDLGVKLGMEMSAGSSSFDRSAASFEIDVLNEVDRNGDTDEITVSNVSEAVERLLEANGLEDTDNNKSLATGYFMELSRLLNRVKRGELGDGDISGKMSDIRQKFADRLGLYNE